MTEYGIFEDGECIESGFYGDLGHVAARATVGTLVTENPEQEYEIRALCPDHEEQPEDACEECFAEEDETEGVSHDV